MSTQRVCPIMSHPMQYQQAPLGVMTAPPERTVTRTHFQNCIGSRCAAWEPGMFDSRLGNCGLAHFGQRFPDPARTETEA